VWELLWGFTRVTSAELLLCCETPADFAADWQRSINHSDAMRRTTNVIEANFAGQPECVPKSVCYPAEDAGFWDDFSRSAEEIEE